jgi:hypothetical protein
LNSDLRDKERDEPVPPEAHRLVAGIDTAIEQKPLDLTERQRTTDARHHRQADITSDALLKLRTGLCTEARAMTASHSSARIALTVPRSLALFLTKLRQAASIPLTMI